MISMANITVTRTKTSLAGLTRNVGLMPSRINQETRGIGLPTPYGRRTERLSNQIFSEIVIPTDIRSLKVVRVMSAIPLEQREDKNMKYYPPLPMYHYFCKLLQLHGVYYDQHVVWREYQDELKLARGKITRVPPGQGKRALLKAKK